MDRAFSSGASGTPPSAPASPSTGYATSGNPGTATPATKPGAWWYHMMTEEVRKVITDAGLTPDYTNLSQLSQAIQAMIANGTANDYKASVRSATVGANITLAGGAPSTLDGVTLVVNDRVLVKDQTTGSQNGLYYVSTLGTGANGTWTRATDADGAGELTSGAVVAVEEGAANADSQWMLTTDGPITIGTTALTFIRDGAGSYASTAEAQALTIFNKAISPGGLAAALQGANQSLSASGYQKFPGGLILQWGANTLGAATVVTLPVAFPTVCYGVVGVAYNSVCLMSTLTLGTSNFTATSYNSTTQGAVGASYYWFAIGK